MISDFFLYHGHGTVLGQTLNNYLVLTHSAIRRSLDEVLIEVFMKIRKKKSQAFSSGKLSGVLHTRKQNHRLLARGKKA